MIPNNPYNLPGGMAFNPVVGYYGLRLEYVGENAQQPPAGDAITSAVQSMTPEEAASLGGVMASGGKTDESGKQKIHLRKAAGDIWNDKSLDEWPENDFRIFCGDLGNEVTDEVLANAFRKFTSFQKARVVRDKRSGKSKGYGFVSFSTPEDMLAALKQMNKKYVGNRPIRVMRSKWKEREIDSDMNKQFSELYKTSTSSSKTLRKFKKAGKPVTGGKKVKESDKSAIQRGRGYYGPGGFARLAHYQHNSGGMKMASSSASRGAYGGDSHLLANI